MPLWWDGVLNNYSRDDYWVIKFNGKPWTADGEAGFRARRLVCRLFEILGNNVGQIIILNNHVLEAHLFLIITRDAHLLPP